MTAVKPDLRLEQVLWQSGYKWVVGIDEAGRGALAGPVAVGAVILPVGVSPESLAGVYDSKLMTPSQRSFWAEKVREVALAWAVGYAQAEEIDAWGIADAVYVAARRALAWLPQADFLLLDYFRLPICELPQVALVKGDRSVLSIAAASVLAKTRRDAWMKRLDASYPQYGFRRHKGYGTAQHRAAIARYGVSPWHRRSFRLPRKA